MRRTIVTTALTGLALVGTGCSATGTTAAPAKSPPASARSTPTVTEAPSAFVQECTHWSTLSLRGHLWEGPGNEALFQLHQANISYGHPYWKNGADAARTVWNSAIGRSGALKLAQSYLVSRCKQMEMYPDDIRYTPSLVTPEPAPTVYADVPSTASTPEDDLTDEELSQYDQSTPSAVEQDCVDRAYKLALLEKPGGSDPVSQIALAAYTIIREQEHAGRETAKANALDQINWACSQFAERQR